MPQALATQQMIRDQEGIDLFDTTQWSGNSPDLNPCENVGAIIKDRVEARMHQLSTAISTGDCLENGFAGNRKREATS